MKVLKIEDNKGYFLNDKGQFLQIDEITKDDLMNLLNRILKEESTMDEFKAELIGNQSHQIIYKSIYDKLNALDLSRDRFKDESDRKYLEAIKKYQSEA